MDGLEKGFKERVRRGLQGPALERRPATEAVAIIEPEEVGLKGDVRSMALAAYLAARKTLQRGVVVIRLVGLMCLGGIDLPENIYFHCFHEVPAIDIREYLVGSSDTCIRKHDIQPSIFVHCLLHDSLHGSLIGCVETPGMDVDFWVKRLNLISVCLEMATIEVAYINCLSAVPRELMGTGTSNT